ncbi:hypothetical protein ABKV19_010327 [Rosa sericea]
MPLLFCSLIPIALRTKHLTLPRVKPPFGFGERFQLPFVGPPLSQSNSGLQNFQSNLISHYRIPSNPQHSSTQILQNPDFSVLSDRRDW